MPPRVRRASYPADQARVSPVIIAAWLGHVDAAFTMRTHVHARPEDLAAAPAAPAVCQRHAAMLANDDGHALSRQVITGRYASALSEDRQAQAEARFGDMRVVG